jgi:hypothetical protein
VEWDALDQVIRKARERLPYPKGQAGRHRCRVYGGSRVELLRWQFGRGILESRLEGVNRRNLKIINLSTHYKSGLALEMNPSLKEREKQINQEIKWMNTMICFTKVWF